MAEVIVGLHVDIKGSELRELLEKRLQYHQEKVVAYEKQLAEMRKVEAILDEEAKKQGKYSNATPVDSMEESLKNHKNQVIYYRFMSTHTVEAAVYRLAEGDLYRLGISTR